jgi:hypothetical protein
MREREVLLRRWLHASYDEHGPAAQDVVEVAFVLDQLRLAKDYVAIGLPDIERATMLRPVVKVDDCEGGVWISVNGNYTTPSVWAWENPHAGRGR